MDRHRYDDYCQLFNARDYDGVLEYWHDEFECFVGDQLLFSNGPELKKVYGFLHSHVDESVIVDRYLSDDRNLFMEARVRLRCFHSMTEDIIRASGLTNLLPIEAGVCLDIPQVIHYHIEDGKFKKALCLVVGAPTLVAED